MPGDVVNINGASVEIIRGNATEENIAQILRTLRAIPPGHIKIVPRVEVFHPFDGYRGGDSGSGYVRLSELCFTSGWNVGEVNVTALHEIGHLVDHRWRCMAWLRDNAREHYDVLMAHPHSGDRTHGDGEHFADAYADYFNSNGQQAHISRRRRLALMASPAFAQLPPHPSTMEHLRRVLAAPRVMGLGQIGKI